jgi:uncharacterized protein YaiL (DUF2058 family)
MSLKDALLAKGLVTKKDARRANQEIRKQRKQARGKQRKKNLVQAEAEDERSRAREEALRVRGDARRKRETEHAQRELGPRIKQVILSNRIAARGSLVFHHRAWKTSQILRLCVSEGVARQLRVGDAGIVALDEATYVVVGKSALEKLEALDASRIAFWVDSPGGEADPAEALCTRPDEESRTPDFRPRRASAVDIERLRRRAEERS